MERIQEEDMKQRNEKLKRLMQSQYNNPSLVQDAGATKIMPIELYRFAKTGNADGFLNMLHVYSSDNKLRVTGILEKVTPNGDSLLHVAVAATNPVNSYHITKLLSPNFPHLIKKRNFHGDTPLHLAAKTGNLEATKVLIDQAQSPRLLKLRNNKGNTALHEAAIHNQLRVLVCLIEEENHQARSSNINGLLELRNNKGNTALHEAVIHHQFQAFDSLIKVYNHSLLSTYQNEECKTPLYLAVETCDVKTPEHVRILECLLQVQPVDEDSLGKLQKRSPAHVAVRKTNLSVIMQKIAELKPQLLRIKDEKGELPLHHAAREGNPLIVGILVENFGDGVIQPNQEGLYPIHVASQGGQVAVVELLLKQWPNPMDFVDAKGKNILHTAAEKGQEKVVRYILKYAANHSEYKGIVNAKDLDGNTPLHLAAKNGHSMAVFTLVRHPLVHKYAVNDENLTSFEIAEKQCKQAKVKYTEENGDEETAAADTTKSPQGNNNNKKKQAAEVESQTEDRELIIFRKPEDRELIIFTKPGDMEAVTETPDDKGRNKQTPEASSKIDFYGAMMTVSILFFHARPRPKSFFIKYSSVKSKPLSKEELNSRIQGLLVVAVLLAGVTFAGALTIPKEPVTQGTTFLSQHDSSLKKVFIFFDMVALNFSVMAAIVLCCAQLSDAKNANHLVWMASGQVAGSFYLMSLTFFFGLVIQLSNDPIFFVVIILVNVVLLILQTVMYIPLITFPGAIKIFERLVAPYVYYLMFLYYFLFQRFPEVLGHCSRKLKAKGFRRYSVIAAGN